MKRLIALSLVLILVLCGCGSEPAPTEPSTQATTEPTAEPTTEPTTEPTEPPVLYRNPLNGEPMDTAYTGRPTAVVINNLKDALPHHGVGDADFLYELETEGGITRMLAVYSDLSNTGSIGPVRSARTFFNNIAVSYNAPIVHCGGSVRGISGYHNIDGGKIEGWAHVNEQNDGSYFFRDEDRYYYQGYNWEHTLFTNGEKLLKAMEKKEYTSTEAADYGLTFDEEAKLDGFIAEKVTVYFRDHKTSTFTYDSASGLYIMSQYGGSYKDANTGEDVSFKNVMVLYTNQWNKHDGHYNRSYYDLVGEGEGYLAINGEIAKIKWSREDLNKPFVYTMEDGTPVTFGVGHTYVGIASAKSDPVEYQ